MAATAPMTTAGADARPDDLLRIEEGRVVLLDQRRLPDEEVELVCRSAAEVADAIRTLAVRGAPAIGIAAADGYALAAAAGDDLDAAATALLASRPTAVNLAWAIAEVSASDGNPADRPAFDVTPAALVGAIVTERGVHRAPYDESLKRTKAPGTALRTPPAARAAR